MQTTLENIRKNLRETLKAGMKTNMGTFTHFDESGAAHYIQPNGKKGWTGRDVLHLIQIRETEPEIEKDEFVLYCGQHVQLLGVENWPCGNLALIRFECGREDHVPLSTIDFL